MERNEAPENIEGISAEGKILDAIQAMEVAHSTIRHELIDILTESNKTVKSSRALKQLSDTLDNLDDIRNEMVMAVSKLQTFARLCLESDHATGADPKGIDWVAVFEIIESQCSEMEGKVEKAEVLIDEGRRLVKQISLSDTETEKAKSN